MIIEPKEGISSNGVNYQLSKNFRVGYLGRDYSTTTKSLDAEFIRIQNSPDRINNYIQNNKDKFNLDQINTIKRHLNLQITVKKADIGLQDAEISRLPKLLQIIARIFVNCFSRTRKDVAMAEKTLKTLENEERFEKLVQTLEKKSVSKADKPSVSDIAFILKYSLESMKLGKKEETKVVADLLSLILKNPAEKKTLEQKESATTDRNFEKLLGDLTLTLDDRRIIYDGFLNEVSRAFRSCETKKQGRALELQLKEVLKEFGSDNSIHNILDRPLNEIIGDYHSGRLSRALEINQS